MGSLFKKPSIPAPVYYTLTTAPTTTAAKTAVAAADDTTATDDSTATLTEKEKTLQKNAVGRASTVLTSGLGLLNPATTERKTLLGQ